MKPTNEADMNSDSGMTIGDACRAMAAIPGYITMLPRVQQEKVQLAFDKMTPETPTELAKPSGAPATDLDAAVNFNRVHARKCGRGAAGASGVVPGLARLGFKDLNLPASRQACRQYHDRNRARVCVRLLVRETTSRCFFRTSRRSVQNFESGRPDVLSH